MPRSSPRIVAHSDGVDVKALERSNGRRFHAQLGQSSNDVSFITADKLAAIRAFTVINKRPVQGSVDQVLKRTEAEAPSISDLTTSVSAPNAPAGGAAARRSNVPPLSMHALLQQSPSTTPRELHAPVLADCSVDTDLVAHAPPQWNTAFYKRRTKDIYKSTKAAIATNLPAAGVPSNVHGSKSKKTRSYGGGASVKEILQEVNCVRAPRAAQPSNRARTRDEHAPNSARDNLTGGVAFKEVAPREGAARVAFGVQQPSVVKKAAKSSKARLSERHFSPREHCQDYMRPLPNNGWIVENEVPPTSDRSGEDDVICQRRDQELSQDVEVLDLADMGDAAIELSKKIDVRSPKHQPHDTSDTFSTSFHESDASHGSGNQSVDDDILSQDDGVIRLAEFGNVAVMLSQNNDERSKLRHEQELQALHANKSTIKAAAGVSSRSNHGWVRGEANVRINGKMTGHRPSSNGDNGGPLDEVMGQKSNVNLDIGDRTSKISAFGNRYSRSSEVKQVVCTPTIETMWAKMANTASRFPTSQVEHNSSPSGIDYHSSDNVGEVCLLNGVSHDHVGTQSRHRLHQGADETSHVMNAENVVKEDYNRYEFDSKSKQLHNEKDELPIRSKWVKRWAQMAQSKL